VSLRSRLLERVGRRRLARLRALAGDPRGEQERQLRNILGRAAATAFGREHGFAGLKSHADFQRAVPLRDYAGMAPWWDRARAGEPDVVWPGIVRFWAISSGTTAGEKFLPVSAETIRNNKKGGFDSMVPHLAQGGGSVAHGRLLFLGGCTELRREGPVCIGDNTGIMALQVPWLVRFWHTPSRRITGMGDWEAKIRAAVAETLGQDLRMLSGVPSWIILFAEEALEQARAAGRNATTLKDLWPGLQLFVHGGVSFAPYRQRFEELAGPGIRTTDTYSASEGGMLGVQDVDGEPGMLPLVDQGTFFEFVPERELDSATPTRLGVHELEPGGVYAVALTTDSGIYGYLVGDLVRCAGRDPIRLEFAGRLAHTLNGFGEHVSGGELDRAIAHAAHSTDSDVAEYAVAAVFPDAADGQGGHRFYVEFRRDPGSDAAFAKAVDDTLQAGNEDYTTHRRFGLRPPEIRRVPHDAFMAWMRRRGKIGGQNKVPRVLSPEHELEFTRCLSSDGGREEFPGPDGPGTVRPGSDGHGSQ